MHESERFGIINGCLMNLQALDVDQEEEMSATGQDGGEAEAEPAAEPTKAVSDAPANPPKVLTSLPLKWITFPQAADQSLTCLSLVLRLNKPPHWSACLSRSLAILSSFIPV